MPLNLGYIEATCNNRDVVARIYYDATQPASLTQPLIDGPRGWCLDMTNVTGRRTLMTVAGVTATPFTITIAQGDPVTTGPTSGRSRTAANLAALGISTRGDVGNLTIDCQ